jgi:hypothetical protein
MENHDKTRRLLRILTAIIEKLLPRDGRKEYLDALEERQSSTPEFVQEAAVLVASSYVIQSKTFNRTSFAAQLAGLIYCFACILLPLPLIVLAAAILGILTFYDFYTSESAGDRPASTKDPDDPSEFREKQSALARFYTDELGAAVILIVMLLAMDFFGRHTVSSLTASRRLFFHAASVFIPIVGAFRLMLRPKPAGKPPLRRFKLSIDQLYRATRYLNDFFASAFIIAAAVNMELGFVSSPVLRFSMWIVMLATFVIWMRLPQNALARDSHIRTLKWESQEAAQRAAYLRTELPKSDPLYKTWAVLNVLLPAVLAAPLAVDLLPWIAGRGVAANLFPFGMNLSLFVCLMVSWNYVKRVNRELAKLLQPPTAAPASKPVAVNAGS